jgi:transcriptional regulator with GAF, ATPase, and Fis domain
VGVFALSLASRLSPDDVRGLSAAAELLAMAMPSPSAAERTVRPLREVEREAIERALTQTGGRVSGPQGAARFLGLKPTTLQSRMKKLGVRRPPR